MRTDQDSAWGSQTVLETAPEAVPRRPRELPPSAVPVQIQRGPVSWVIDPDLLSELGTPDPLLEPKAGFHPCAVVKTGPHRTVYRLELPSGEYYVKHFRAAGWRPLLQNLVRPCKAELEWRALRAVSELGLPTIEPMALGQTRRLGLVGESFLVTRSIEGGVALDQFLLHEFPRLPRARQVRIRQGLATGLGDLGGQLHARGGLHPDLHPGNVLVRLGEDDGIELWLIDLHSVQFPNEVNLQKAARSLAALNQFFQARTSSSDRRRFFRAYCAARNWDRLTERAFVREFETACRRATLRLWNRADRAWRRGNRHQQRLDTAGVACRGLATLDAGWLRSVRDAPEVLFEQGLQWWCKQSGKRRVAAVSVPSPHGWSRAYWKAIEESGTGRQWWSRLRGSAVRRAWETGHAFLRRGIATPRPLLYVESRGRDADRSYLLTEAVPESATLAEFCRTVWPSLSGRAQRQWLHGTSRSLARQLRWMHACRYDHRDLKFENILVPCCPDRTETWLLDLDAVFRWLALPPSRNVQNLARLNVSTIHLPTLTLTDRLRFLRWYLDPAEWPGWKAWWRRIANKSRRKERQNRRRGRPLS